MTRRTLSMLLVAIVAVLSFGSFAEAAGPKKVIRHRVKHSTRVSSAHRAHTTPVRRVVTRKHKKQTAAKKHAVKAARKPLTKPR